MTTPNVFNEIWDKGSYRLGSTCQRLVPFLRQHIPAGAEVNDYGSGTGRAEKGLLEFCAKVNMVDFADAALEEEAKSLIGPRLTYTIAPLESLPADFPHAEWGICINVLMLIDPSKLHDICREIKRTCEHAIIEVYDWKDVRLGEDRTTIKMLPEGWIQEFNKHWPVVEYYRSPEHSHRYIFICHNQKQP